MNKYLSNVPMLAIQCVVTYYWPRVQFWAFVVSLIICLIAGITIQEMEGKKNA